MLPSLVVRNLEKEEVLPSLSVWTRAGGDWLTVSPCQEAKQSIRQVLTYQPTQVQGSGNSWCSPWRSWHSCGWHQELHSLSWPDHCAGKYGSSWQDSTTAFLYLNENGVTGEVSMDDGWWAAVKVRQSGQDLRAPPLPRLQGDLARVLLGLLQELLQWSRVHELGYQDHTRFGCLLSFLIDLPMISPVPDTSPVNNPQLWNPTNHEPVKLYNVGMIYQGQNLKYTF